jgi:unsaturated chondroitin disaccharide hydrolase
MMNLEILLFAALEVSDADCGGCTQLQREKLNHIAQSHTLTSAKNHIRPDGSISHIVCYDPMSGQERFTCNGGGYLDNTTWARGQAWSIYGFTMVYRYTRTGAHLNTATKLADFYLQAINTSFPDSIPNFDLTYQGLGPVANLSYRDASAAAIAASGLIELSGYVNSTLALPAKAQTYLDYAQRVVTALSAPPYQSVFAEQEGAIRHCNAQETDVPWADYYLLEAIQRLRSGVPPH